jgi:CheY-like chemotaxis protein
MSERNPVVLVVDDEVQIRRFLRAGLELDGFSVQDAETGRSPQGGLATVRAKTAPEARALVRWSTSKSMFQSLSRKIICVNFMSV